MGGFLAREASVHLAIAAMTIGVIFIFIDFRALPPVDVFNYSPFFYSGIVLIVSGVAFSIVRVIIIRRTKVSNPKP